MPQADLTPLRALLAIMLGLAPPLTLAEDWPQWRGPNRDGVWRETGILEAIPASGLTFRWRTRVGHGYSGPVVAQGRVFVTDHVFEPELERVLCFDEATGASLWVHAHPCDYKDMEYGNGPRASPMVHEGMVYTLGTQGDLLCLEAATGSLVWKRNLAADFQGAIPRYGASAAPLVVEDLLIVCAGGQPDASVVALDRTTGERRWQALADRPAYSAPILIEAGGARQLVVWTADSITGLEPASGRVFWQVPWKASFDPAQMVASPVWHKDRLLLMGAWSRGSKMLALDGAKPEATVLWETRTKPTTTLSTPLFQDDDHVYAVLGNGSLACLDAATGDEVWSTREPTSGSYGNAHLTPNGDRVFLFNHIGHLILARLTPQGYHELGRALLVEPTAGFRAQGPITWAHPAYANRHVVARNDRELVRASLAAEPVIQTPSPPPTPEEAGKAERLAYFETNPALGLAISPDGKALAAGTWQGLVKVIDLSNGQDRPGPAPHRDWVCSVAFSPDGRWLVSAGGSEFKPERNRGQTTGQVKLWDVKAAMDLGEFTGHSNKVFSAAFASDGRTLATASADQTVRLWNVPARNPIHVLTGHQDAVWSVTFSPDGSTVASGGADRLVKLWHAASGEERATLRGHEDEVRAVAFSPAAGWLASGGADWTVRIWDGGTGTERAVLRAHRGTVHALAFSPDGRLLAAGSADETVTLWETDMWTEQARLRGHRSGVAALAFSPDGRTLATAGLDDAVRVWTLPDLFGAKPRSMHHSWWLTIILALRGAAAEPPRNVSRLLDPDPMPGRVHVFEDYETDIEKRWWLRGVLETNQVPPSRSTSVPNRRASRATVTKDFDDLMGDPSKTFKAVIFNPVPGPPMGARTRLSFRYRLEGTDALRVQIYTLSKGYHRFLTLTNLPREAWQSATVDMTQARRPDGSGGPLAEDERIDDIQFYVASDAGLLIDDIVLYDAAPDRGDEPFPARIAFTGWFDTGQQGAGKEWPGDFEIVPHEAPRTWKAARSVVNPGSGRPWIRAHLRGGRPLGALTRLRFRHHLTGGDRIEVTLADTATGRQWRRVLEGLAAGQWSEATLDLEVSDRGAMADELHFVCGPGAALRVDDVLLFEPGPAATD